MRQHYDAYAKLDHDVVWVNHRWGKKDWYRWQWDSFDLILAICSGEGHRGLAGYDLFRSFPLNDGEIQELQSASRRQVSGYYDYDSVNRTDVKIL